MRFKKVLFIDLWESFYDRNPVYALTAILHKNNVDVDYAFSKNPALLLKRIVEYKPDLVMYSAFSVHVPKFIEFDKTLKKLYPHIYTMIGGPGVNDKASHRDIMNSSINSACIGEGDISLDDFIKTDGECHNNIVAATDLTKPYNFNKFVELDTLPFPVRDPVYRRDPLRAVMPSKQFMSGRGCPYKCTYCHNHLEHELFKGSGRTVRLKSVDYLIEEIKQVKQKYPLETIVFQDDIFLLNKKWGQEFAEKFPRELGLPFTCNVRSNLVDEEIVRSLKEAGCQTVAWAIESGDEEMRNKLLKRNVTDESIIRAGELFNRFGIKHRVNNVIGSPGETFEQILKTLELNIKVKPYMSSAHIFIPFQGLELTEYAISNGYLSPNAVQTLPNTFAEKTVLNFSEFEKIRIKKLMYLFPILTAFPSLYHNKTFFKFLLATNVRILGWIYEPVHLYFWSRMYRVSASLRTQLRILMRYFSYGN